MFISAGKFHRHRIIAPRGKSTRPTSSRLRETVFNILQDAIVEADFLDVCAGSGAMGIEALSRGAKQATFIECHPSAIRCIQDNLKNLQIAEQAILMRGDFLKMLKKLSDQQCQFDCIFVDAPYDMTIHGHDVGDIITQWMETHPILKPHGHLFIEDNRETPPKTHAFLVWKSSRRSGKAYLHHFEAKYATRK